ncbi:hypothetical protein CJU89_1740 [Yarrowia sp. B02]|nr:hypothetical protein CJU89_1740 [Yarrowia sp. B02]
MTPEKAPDDVTSPSQDKSLNNTASEMQVDALKAIPADSPPPPDASADIMRSGLKIAATALSLLCLWYLFAPSLKTLVVWNFEDLLIGDVSSDTVFLQRLHAYVTDDLGTCEVPAWVPEGTLVTSRDDCEVPHGWEIQKLPHLNVPAFDFTLDSCSRGERMLCLVLSNSDPLPFGPRHKKKPLHQITRQTLSLYTNEDYSWGCNAHNLTACQVVPGGSARCILEEMVGLPFGSEHDRKATWSTALRSCKTHQNYISWNRS